MRTSLGVSLGAANLVAVADGRPTVRPAMLTLNGQTLTGFVDRVGDPVPLVAADGSAHYGGQLVASAVESLTRSVHPLRRPDVAAVAVPAHWSPTAVAALRAVAPHLTVVSDAVAALTALRANPGLPTRGVVALCDFGATGSSITLADAGDGFRVIGSTVRYDDFSGDLIDQAVLRHVLADLDLDPSGTSAVASLASLRDECRGAKERLSVQTATALSGPGGSVRLTRPELEALLAGPLAGFVDAVVDVLHRNGVAPAQLAAVATVGGGARIPLVTQQLSQALRLPVVTGPYAQVAAAAGAELMAARAVEQEAVTTLAAAVDAAETVAAVPLAWSAETVDVDAATEYVQPVYDAGLARPDIAFDHDSASEEAKWPWYRRPGALFAGAACVAALAATGLILTSHTGDAGAVDAGSSAMTAPVAAQPMEHPAAVPVPMAPPVPAAVTQTVIAAPPAPNVVAPQQQSAPSAERRVASKQAGPVPVPAPAPAPGAPAPAPAPAAPAPAPAPVVQWPRLPLPPITFNPPATPDPQPSPSPEPEPTVEPQPQPSAEPEPTVEPQPQPSAEPEPTAAPESTAEPEPAPSECVPDAESVC